MSEMDGDIDSLLIYQCEIILEEDGNIRKKFKTFSFNVIPRNIITYDNSYIYSTTEITDKKISTIITQMYNMYLSEVSLKKTIYKNAKENLEFIKMEKSRFKKFLRKKKLKKSIDGNN